MQEMIEAIDGTAILDFSSSQMPTFPNWRADRDGPPVPVLVERAVWQRLVSNALLTSDHVERPRVFRLLMRRRFPCHVVDASEIRHVQLGPRGVIRWEEGQYPASKEPIRKGGNAFIRQDAKLLPVDAWWMGDEKTDVRILIAGHNNVISVSAYWARKNPMGNLGQYGSDGEPWPVKLLIGL